MQKRALSLASMMELTKKNPFNLHHTNKVLYPPWNTVQRKRACTDVTFNTTEWLLHTLTGYQYDYKLG